MDNENQTIEEVEQQALELVAFLISDAERQVKKKASPEFKKAFNAETITEAYQTTAELHLDPDENFEDFLALSINQRFHWDFNETQLWMLRNFARMIVDSDEVCRNVLKHYKNHIVGAGINTEIIPKQIGDPEAIADTLETDAQIKLLTDNWNAFYKANNLTLKLQNWVERAHRDGEAIVRIFDKKQKFLDKEVPIIRFVDPTWIRGEDFENGLHLGVHFNLPDIEGVTALQYIPQLVISDTKVSGEEIPITQIIFDKRNVDTDTFRGISSFYTVLTNIRRISKNLVNVSVLTQILSAIALIRKHENASTARVQSFLNAASDGIQRQNKLTGKDIRTKVLSAGTVLDAPSGISYDYPAHNVKTENFIQVIDKELAHIALCFNLPVEWLKGGDVNIKESPLSESSPVVKNFRSEQAILFTYVEDLFWRVQSLMGVNTDAVRAKYDAKFFGPDLATADPEAQARVDEIHMRLGATSPQTIAAKSGRSWATERANVIRHRRTAQPGEVMPGDLGNTNVKDTNPSASTGGDGKTTANKATPQAGA